MADPLYDLTSQLYSANWYSGLYLLDNRASGHCHTFNPENVSVAGHQGQLYAYLGQLPQLPASLTTGLTEPSIPRIALQQSPDGLHESLRCLHAREGPVLAWHRDGEHWAD